MNQQIVVEKNLLSYKQFGTGDSEVSVVFLHGWRSNKEVWARIASVLISASVNQQISCYTVDLPGFGGSPAPKTSWTVGDYAELVKGFLEKLELKNVVLVGHSFGGRVAIKTTRTYAEGNAELRGRLTKLVLVDAAGFAVSGSKKSVYGFVAKIARPVFKPKFMQGLRKSIYKTIGAEDYLATPELRETFINVTQEDLTEDLKQIKIPTLLVWGENDKDTPVEFGEKMHSLIQNSKFKILQNSGHFSFLDQPEEFVKTLKEFLSSPL